MDMESGQAQIDPILEALNGARDHIAGYPDTARQYLDGAQALVSELKAGLERDRVRALLDEYSVEHGLVVAEYLGRSAPDEGEEYFWECRLPGQPKGCGYLGAGPSSQHAANAARALAAKAVERGGR